ncbi:related to transporter (major facilitator superfamily) [Phialocephala subalpina]|uniref:Related to transporter (Major facilitator superfamily) n=1 Tax=Phialocephala subalpina TaxID=576137 RepID=A0A1L7XCP3_9HELO|nr:related to transporter (major facilitator superfamily) [Phialocephala subalpina]
MDSSNTSDADTLQANQLEKSEKNSIPDSGSDANNEITAADQSEFVSGYQLFLLVFATSMAGFLYALDVNIIVTAIPVITTHFKTIKDIGWYGSAYLLTLCACSPIIGKIYQFYNSKITFFIFVFIFEVGSLVCAIAPTSTALVIGRAVAGFGGSGLFSGGLTIIGASLPPAKRAQTVALVYVFSMTGSIVAPLIGGVLTEKASWRWCFYINLPLGAIALTIITFIRIPERRAKIEKKPTLYETVNRLDPVGFALFSPACIMVLLALQWGGSTYAWNSSTIVGLFVGSALTLPVFIFWEKRRGEMAMIPLSLFTQRVVYSSCLVAFFQYGALLIFAYYLPVWFQTILGVNPLKSGAYFMATAAPLITATLASGILGKKIGTPTIYTLVGNAIAMIGGGLMTTFKPSSSTGVWVGYQILAGLGRGLVNQQPINAVQYTLDHSKMAVGTSLVVFSQFFGGALILALAETDFSSSLRSTLKEYAPSVDPALVVAAGATGIRKAVTSEQLPGVLKAYNQAVTNTFILGCAASGVAFLAAWGMGLKRTKKSEPTAPGEA